MVEITLVRHGQAQTGAKDEASYDRLSGLGVQQAEWLGAHLAEMGQAFDRVISGPKRRQRETAERIVSALGLPMDEDERLDEMDYFGLSKSMKETHALPMPTDRDGFLTHVAEVIQAWDAGLIASPAESFEAFEARVKGVIAEAEATGGRVMLVTSGGVIGMAMRVLLRLDLASYTRVLLQINNTSLHRYVKAGEMLVLDTFNAVPHLERADRQHAKTHV